MTIYQNQNVKVHGPHLRTVDCGQNWVYRSSRYQMRAHRASDTLVVADLHEMITPLERVPYLEPFWQKRCWIMESDDFKLETKSV